MTAMWERMLGRGGRSQHYDRGIRLFDQGWYEQAIEAFQSALSESKGGGSLTERLARFYLAESYSSLAMSQRAGSSQGDPIANLKAAIALSPNYADLHYHLGCAYLDHSRPELAEGPLRRAIAINPRYARAHLYLGVALAAQGRIQEGLRSAETATALDAALRQELLPDARVALNSGDHEEAVALLRRMAETENDDAFFHAQLAQDLYRRGMLDAAADEYRQALALRPEYADLRNRLGITLYDAQRNEEALVEFERALAINPRYTEARLNYGLALLRLERLQEAQQAFVTVLELEPEHREAQEHLAALTRAQAA